MKKYVFLDLDGTIIDHSSTTLRDSTVTAVKQLQQNGHEVFIATGRPPCLFYGIDKELNIESYIGANGRIVSYKGDIIYKQVMNKKELTALVEFFDQNQIEVGFEAEHEYVLHKRYNGIGDKFNKAWNIYFSNEDDQFIYNNDIYQLILYVEDFSKLEEKCKEFNTFTFTYSNKYGYDVTQSQGMKDVGIKILKEHLGFEYDDVVCIGDGLNDLSMIELAEIGIAMGNGNEILKQASDYVTESVEDDGLYKALKHYKLI